MSWPSCSAHRILQSLSSYDFKQYMVSLSIVFDKIFKERGLGGVVVRSGRRCIYPAHFQEMTP